LYRKRELKKKGFAGKGEQGGKNTGAKRGDFRTVIPRGKGEWKNGMGKGEIG